MANSVGVLRYDELLDSLSPYEVAVWAMTSPSSYDEEGLGGGGPILLTTKDSYLWGGAVAHILLRDPALDRDAILRAFRSVISENAGRIVQYMVGQRRELLQYQSPGPELVRQFLQAFGAGDDVAVVVSRTDEAVANLVWRQAIEDPWGKKIGAFLVSVSLLVPVSFTSRGPEGTTIETLTWKYVQGPAGDHQQRAFHFKVREITQAITEELVPSVVSFVDAMARPEESNIVPISEAQRQLAGLGYYHGAIDGLQGDKTTAAIRAFQREEHLGVTGHLDPATSRRLARSG